MTQASPLPHRPVILLGTTVATTARSFLADQMRYLADHGWTVHLATGPGADYQQLASDLDWADSIQLHPIAMARNPHPFKDLRAAIAWLLLVRQVAPDVVMTGTPKAGLLGMAAARLLRVPHRVYLARGLRLEGLRGVQRVVSMMAEKVTCAAATHVVCVSPSLRSAFVSRGLVASGKVTVLGDGSSNGVDTRRFSPGSESNRALCRRRFGVLPNHQAIGFAGRLTDDKGLQELIQAFRALRHGWPDAVLLLAGDPDEASPLTGGELEDPSVLALGNVSDMPGFLRALDIFCLPSRREGFPNVSIEAAAVGLPVVTTDATGCRDSVVDGTTGRIVPTRDAAALRGALSDLLAQPEERRRMGAHARQWAVERFSQEVVWHNTLSFINGLIEPEQPQAARSRNRPLRRRAAAPPLSSAPATEREPECAASS